MPKLNNTVRLRDEEIEELKALTHKGAGESVKTIMHAHILLITNDNPDGKKMGIRETAELLGLWIGASEGAKYWMSVLAGLKNRGVRDILIASMDGLTGFSDAVAAVFPKTDVQRCIIHQIRASTKWRRAARSGRVSAES
ncbi:hypothetical protein AGMMS49992_21820 [Clostridia bacterium]|nr:hypothetical protein AGMMS49992_21820 [Clostridia bacterium]